MQSNALQNIFRITEDIFEAQNQLTSLKRVNKPSDDPAAVRNILGLRTTIDQGEQYIRNIDFNTLMISSADTALNTADINLIRANELAINQLNATSTGQTREFAAEELDQIIEQVLVASNTQVKNQYIFSGTKTRTQPFTLSGSEISYHGNTESILIEVSRGATTRISVPGSETFGTDLNPRLTTATPLSDLNAGTGVASGTFTITDREGNSSNVNVTGGMDLNDVINAINSAGVNVTASINSDQNGLLLSDTSSLITGALEISDTGNTASDLGILGRRDGDFNGEDLDPSMSTNTAVSDLIGGDGLTLGTINIVNSAASGVVTLSSANTINDVINAINGSGLNVTASINSQGNGLMVTSNDPTTVAVVTDIGTGTTAEDLGLGGGRNVFTTLINLRDALRADDQPGIIASLVNLDSSLDKINEGRADLGAVLRRMEDTDQIHQEDIVDQADQMSDLEDTDFTATASRLVQLETAFQATLDTTARIIQPSLLNFLS